MAESPARFPKKKNPTQQEDAPAAENLRKQGHLRV